MKSRMVSGERNKRIADIRCQGKGQREELFSSAEPDGERGDNEATKGDVILVRLCADELHIRFSRITPG